MKHFFSLFLAFFVTTQVDTAWSATGGQYGNYSYKYIYVFNGITYRPIPIATVRDNWYDISLYDPRQQTVITTYDNVGQVGDPIVNNTWAYPQNPQNYNGYTSPPVGFMNYSSWNSFYYGSPFYGSPYYGNTSNNQPNYYGGYYSSPSYYGIAARSINSGDAVIITGGDFNGDTIEDLLTYNSTSRTVGVRYTMGNGTYVQLGSEKIIRLAKGVTANQVFFVNPDGHQDWIAVVQSRGKSGATVRLINPANSATRTLRLQGVTATTGTAPKPVQLSNGRDLMLFYRHKGNGTTLTLKDLRGRTVSSSTVLGNGEVVVGDYADSPGDEIAVRNGAGFTIYNPTTRATSSVAAPEGGRALDSINRTRM